MLSRKMNEALNDQIGAETYSAYLYLAMSSSCSALGYKGAAMWFFVQMQEELTHALRIYAYVNKQGGRVVLGAIDKPPANFGGIKQMYEAALKHEKYITDRINKLVKLARAENDHATEVFLQWFVNEQVEEEQNDMDVLSELKLAGDHGGALLMIDRELGARTFTLPADLGLSPEGSPAGGAA